MNVMAWLGARLPGVALCLGVSAIAVGLESVEVELTGRAWIEGLVLAILIGLVTRFFWTPSARWKTGVSFSAKQLLELAVVLLGASVSFRTVINAGPVLLFGIFGVVIVAIGFSYTIGRTVGLNRKLALLVACGNSICGNTAIATVAPVIGAGAGEVASAIAFTAVLGVVVVLSLPIMGHLIGLTQNEYGILSGLTVYAVPQVLAATMPVGGLAVQVGTLVKLMRVLMLGPVVLSLSLMMARLSGEGAGQAKRKHALVPWFIIGFLVAAGLRSSGVIPEEVVKVAMQVAGVLTVVSMAGLGLEVDPRSVVRAGARVSVAVTASLLLLGAISFGLVVVLRTL